MDMLRDFVRARAIVAVGDKGMAATSHPEATLAAISTLRDGGNAIDAALAAVAVQCVVEPGMTGIGGDCFAIYAPARGPSWPSMDRAQRRAALPWTGTRSGGSTRLKSRHRMPSPSRAPSMLGARCMPIRNEAAGSHPGAGHPVRARRLRCDATRRLRLEAQRYEAGARPDTAAQYLPGGEAPAVGDRMMQPALAATLEQIARVGRKAFYEGDVAEEICAKLVRRGRPPYVGGFLTICV